MEPKRPGGFLPSWPLENRKLHMTSTNPHEVSLWKLHGAYNGARAVRESFAARKAEIEQRGRDGELGPRGVQKELKALVAEFEPRLRELGSLVEEARKHHGTVRDKLTAREIKKSADADEAVRRALAEDRAIRRFESLQPAQRREAVRVAIEKRDAQFLSTVLAEPGLIDETTARVVQTELMRAGNRVLFAEYQELGGKMDERGEVDPLTSPLITAAYVLDSTREWMEEQSCGVDAATTLRRAGVEIGDGPAVVLNPEQAKDPSVYRAARDAAHAAGKLLTVTGDEGGTITPPSSGNGSGAPSDGGGDTGGGGAGQ